MNPFFKELTEEIERNNIKNIDEILKLRDELAKKHKPKYLPSLIQIFLALKNKEKYFQILTTKPSRSLSGVSVVALMTKPYPCPKKEPCIMCPSGENTPQSYMGKEPATLRAIRNNYHPYPQIFNRLEQYLLLNIIPSKIELIIMGGNFTSMPLVYQNKFVQQCYQALNDFSRLFIRKNKINFKKFINFFELDSENLMNKEKQEKINKKVLSLVKNKTLEQSKKENELLSEVKATALCIESRPDYLKEKNIKILLNQGATRIELGAQSVYPEVLKKINREHSLQDTIKATQLLKDSSYKLGYHILLGAPGSSIKKDIDMFKELFKNPDFKPDALKIYPCMVFKGTKLYDLYKQGKYSPLTTEQAVKIIQEGKKYIPEYCRVMRVQRDIPSYLCEAGVDRTNLRQYIKADCKCIRCREISRVKKVLGKPRIKIQPYNASKGKEFFISYETDNALIGFLRLRFPFKPFLNELQDSALIRELHVYGQQTPVGEKGLSFQHKGIGKMLLDEAENIAKDEYDKINVISGVGVKGYYKKFGYNYNKSYMAKKL